MSSLSSPVSSTSDSTNWSQAEQAKLGGLGLGLGRDGGLGRWSPERYRYQGRSQRGSDQCGTGYWMEISRTVLTRCCTQGQGRARQGAVASLPGSLRLVAELRQGEGKRSRWNAKKDGPCRDGNRKRRWRPRSGTDAGWQLRTGIGWDSLAVDWQGEDGAGGIGWDDARA